MNTMLLTFYPAPKSSYIYKCVVFSQLEVSQVLCGDCDSVICFGNICARTEARWSLSTGLASHELGDFVGPLVGVDASFGSILFPY